MIQLILLPPNVTTSEDLINFLAKSRQLTREDAIQLITPVDDLYRSAEAIIARQVIARSPFDSVLNLYVLKGTRFVQNGRYFKRGQKLAIGHAHVGSIKAYLAMN